jgi:hypothetical protein
VYYAYLWYIYSRKLVEADLKVAEKERGVVQAERKVLEEEEDTTDLQLAKAER